MCESTGNLFSVRIMARLKSTFGASVGVQSSATLSHSVGGNWYCPRCAVKMAERPAGNFTCPECTGALNEFVYELIELNPHIDEG